MFFVALVKRTALSLRAISSPVPREAGTMLASRKNLSAWGFRNVRRKLFSKERLRKKSPSGLPVVESLPDLCCIHTARVNLKRSTWRARAASRPEGQLLGQYPVEKPDRLERASWERPVGRTLYMQNCQPIHRARQRWGPHAWRDGPAETRPKWRRKKRGTENGERSARGGFGRSHFFKRRVVEDSSSKSMRQGQTDSQRAMAAKEQRHFSGSFLRCLPRGLSRAMRMPSSGIRWRTE